MAKARFTPTERIGVNAVEGITLNELRWLFREQATLDFGIDAHIEYDDGSGFPSGKLIGAQIKTGPSHVKKVGNKYVFRGKLKHLDYWLKHSLPVILIVHLPGEGTYWQVIDQSTVKRTAKAWTIDIPVKNVFGKARKHAIEDLFEGSPTQQKLNRLAADKELMQFVAGGGKIAVEMEDWVNKSLGRTPVNIYKVVNGKDELEKAYGLMYSGYKIKEVAQRLFPWARIQIDEEFYGVEEDEETEDQKLARAIDEDNGIFEERLTADDIRPYDDSSMEVSQYRLQLKLNAVGEAYLKIAEYLNFSDEEWAKTGGEKPQPAPPRKKVVRSKAKAKAKAARGKKTAKY